MTEITFVINEFEKEVIVFNTITCLRLFELGNDPTLLYLFYIKTSKIQGTKSVYATNSFCMKGLGWGKTKFENAKKILVDNNLIENITKRDEKGQVLGHYVRIHYLRNAENLIKSGIPSTSPVSQKVDETTFWMEPPSGCGEANTINKNINTTNMNENTNNENLNIVPDGVNRVFSEWNKCNIIVHKGLTSSLVNLITRALKLYSEDEILDAINNYGKVINNSDLYFFTYKWSLQEFLQRGLSKQGQANKKGFIQFLSENNPLRKFLKKDLQEIDILFKEFAPISASYKYRGIDKNTQTYLGFKTENLTNDFLMKEYISDIKRNYNNSSFSFGDYCYLEEVITSIFFNRKSGYDMELLKALFSIWKEMKPKFKMQAAEMLEV